MVRGAHIFAHIASLYNSVLSSFLIFQQCNRKSSIQYKDNKDLISYPELNSKAQVYAQQHKEKERDI